MIRSIRCSSGWAILAALSLAFLSNPMAHAWGNEGHRMINRLAASTLPVDLPSFMRTQAAIRQIEYLGPEPDRWRSPAEPELEAIQAPEHFIDLELAEPFAPLPHRRLEFEAKVFAANQHPEKIGLQPWQATEVWERLKAAMREYRQLSASKQDTAQVEQAILFYTGWLGHYVGDAAQPLHTTVHYNGWIGPNPHGYTTSHKIHWQLEGPFVAANITEEAVKAKLAAYPTQAIQGNLFDAYLFYLHESSTHVEMAYQLEKAGGFVGAGTPESRDFIAGRIAVGTAMLRDMIYTAWLESAKPVADPYAAK